MGSIDWHRRTKVLRARRQSEYDESRNSAQSQNPRAYMPTKDTLKEKPKLTLTKEQENAERRRIKKDLEKRRAGKPITNQMDGNTSKRPSSAQRRKKMRPRADRDSITKVTGLTLEEAEKRWD